MNRGKDFENKFKEQMSNVFNIDRLKDSTNGYLGNSNISDFILYYYPYQYYIELKSTKGNTLPFSNITNSQWHGLIDKETIEGVGAGIVVWFLEHDKTFFVSAGLLKQLKYQGKKSLHINDLIDRASRFELTEYFKCFEVEGIKKRVFFDYNVEKFKNNLEVYINYGK